MRENEAGLGGSLREFRRAAAGKVWEGLLRRLNLEFSEESRQNILSANELLKENSVVFYISHTSMTDAELAVPMVFNFLTNAKRIIGPAAMKHYDPARDFKSAMLLRALKPLGIQILPIVQPEDKDSTNANIYSDKRSQRMSANLRIITENVMKLPGSVYGIAPEGTRSDNGALLPAKKGIGYLEAYDQADKLRYLPVAIVYGKFSNHPKIEVGKPLSLGEMNLEKSSLPKDPKERAQYLADVHMQRLADMLPPEMRGVYRN